MSFITIPWKDLPDFTQTIKLDNTLYRLRARWNTVYEFWTIDIYDKNGVALLLGQKLVVNTDILARYTNTALPQGKMFIIDSGIATRQVEKIGRNDIGVNALLVYEGV